MWSWNSPKAGETAPNAWNDWFAGLEDDHNVPHNISTTDVTQQFLKNHIRASGRKYINTIFNTMTLVLHEKVLLSAIVFRLSALLNQGACNILGEISNWNNMIMGWCRKFDSLDALSNWLRLSFRSLSTLLMDLCTMVTCYIVSFQLLVPLSLINIEYLLVHSSYLCYFSRQTPCYCLSISLTILPAWPPSLFTPSHIITVQVHDVG